MLRVSAYPAAPDSEDGWEKLFSERLYLAFRRNYGIPTYVARTTTYSAPMAHGWAVERKPRPPICRKIAMATSGDEIEVWGDGVQTRSFLYIDECIEGTTRLIRSAFSGPVNVGSEEMVTINQLVDLVAGIAGKRIIKRHVDGPQGVRGRNSDNRLIKQQLQWEPSLPLLAGLGTDLSVDRIAVPQHHAQAVRLVVHDYVGHPFQVHLSRHLAKRGHEVSHIYFADHPGPKGSFENQPNDPPSLRFIGITLGGSAEHAAGSGAQTGFARRFGDVAYGREVARVIQGFKPDVVLSGNTPTEAQRAILRSCKSCGVGFVYWVQDIYSMAVTKYLSERLGYPGKAIGWYYQWLDRCQFQDSDAIIVISEDFAPLVGSWAGNDNKVSVIENWAAIDDLPSGLKDNDWSRDHSLHSDLAFVYSGTLGRKHSPMLLLRLAQACRAGELVVVAGQGFGIPQLQAAKTEHRIDALKLLPIQPARHLADVTGHG